MQLERRAELGAIVAIAAPLAVTQVSQLVMNLAASFMLGRISGQALAAGGLCAVFIQALSVLSQGIISGAHPLMAAALGRRELAASADEDGVAFAFGGAVVVALLCSLVGLGLLLALPHLLGLFSVPSAVLDGVREFLAYAAWALPAILCIAPLRFYFSVVGKSWLIMAAIGLGALLYVALLNLLVIGNGGVAPLGVAGAGIAFTVSWWSIAVGLTSFCLVSGHLPISMVKSAVPTAVSAFREVWRIGWPIGLIYAAEFGMTIAMTLMVTSFGTIAIVANQIANTLNNIAFNPIVALGQAATVRVAYHLGGGDAARAKNAGNMALLITFCVMALFGIVLLALLASGHLTMLFLDPGVAGYSEIAGTTRSLILILVAFLIFDGLQAVASGCLRGLKDTRMPLIIGLSGYWLIGIPTAVVLAFGLNLGVIGIWFGTLSGITSVAIMLAWRWRRSGTGTMTRSAAKSARMAPAGVLAEERNS